MPDATVSDKRLTINDVAALWGCDRDHVLRLIHQKLLPAANIGLGSIKPRWIILRADLEAFERNRANITAPAPKRPKRRQKAAEARDYFPD